MLNNMIESHKQIIDWKKKQKNMYTTNPFIQNSKTG